MNDGSVTLALAQGMNGTTTSTDTTVNSTNQAGMRGTIRSIVGEVVTIQMPNGESRAVTVSEEQITKLNLRPGMTIVATPMSNSDNANVRVELANDTTSTNMASMRGTVRSVAGDVVTVEMPDGTTQTITLSRADSTRMNLTPGSQVMVMMNNGVATLNMATNTGLTTDTTDTTGINSSTTTLERQTSISTDTTAPSTVNQQPAAATTTRTTVTQQRTSTRPTTTRPAARRAVRALW
jgi:molybdopterin-binding protein